jgi:hypothetical protein
MFEFYWPDLLNDAPFLFSSLLRMCAAGLGACAFIVLVDWLQYPKWLAKGETNGR